jgi:basic membrane protein A
MTLVGCGCGGNQQATDMNTPGQPGGSGRMLGGQKVGKHLTVGVVFDSGGRGDKSFNDSAFNGTVMADKDLDIKVVPVESHAEKDYETNMTTLAEQGCDLVFAIGISQNKAIEAVAPKYPKVKFAIVDAIVNQPNVRSLVFAEQEGSFLAGYEAALVSKSGKIGFVGGKQIPLILKFEVGYEAGAKTANPKIQVLPPKFTDSWDNIDLGKAAADTLYNDGADIVYHAAGRCGLGVFNAAKEHGKYAIGVDSDQDDVKQGTILTSMVKHVDQAVYQTIKDTATDKFTPGTKEYNLKVEGVGLSAPKSYTKDVIGKETLARVAKIAESIKKGTLKVPSTPDTLAAYLKTAAATPAAPAPKK